MPEPVPTRYFADALADILATAKPPLSLRQFAQAIGVAPSVLSRLHNSRLESATLRKALDYFETQPAHHERLLCAYLWDEIQRVGVDPHEFWERLTTAEGGWFKALPPSLQADVQAMAQFALAAPHIRATVHALAESYLRGLTEQAFRAAEGRDEDTKPSPQSGAKGIPYLQRRKRRAAGE